MKIKNTAVILLLAHTLHAETEPHESFKDKVEVVAIVVKDTVTDTADTVKRSVQVGADVAKDFIASTAARIKIAMQEARVKQAQQKADAARHDKELAQKELADVQEQLRIIKATLKAAQEKTNQK